MVGKKRMLLLVLMLSLFAASAAMAADSVKAYTTLEEPLAKALFEAFEKETGIHVEWVRLTTGEAVARIEAEKANPQVSIWVGGVGTLHIDAKDKGLTTPYRSRAVESIPAKYRDPDGSWIGLYIGPISFATNTKRAQELGLKAPASWADLLLPEYEKKVRMANPSTSGTAYNVVTTLIRVAGDEGKAFDFMKKLDKSIDQYTKSGSAPGKNCAIGEIPVAIGYLHDLIKLKVTGAPLEIVVPEDGTGFETASLSLIKGGPDAVNAKKLYDWILGESAAKIIAGWYVIPLSQKAPALDTGFSLAQMKLVDQNDVWDAEQKARLLERWQTEVGSAAK